MELTRRWLALVGGEAGAALAPSLARLPGRSAHGARGDLAIAAAEFSEREGERGLRLAWNVDGERAEAGAVSAFLHDRGVAVDGLDALLAAHPHAHVQVGVDGEKTKLYAYRRPLPGLLAGLAAIAEGREREDAAFACLDFEAAAVLKQYAEFASAEALAASARLVAEPALDAVFRALPTGLSTGPAPYVLTQLQVRGLVVGHTLHVAVDAAPERLADLAGPELAARLAAHFRAAARLGLRLRPTYVSWSRRRSPAPLRTAYYRLEPARP